MDSVYPVPDNYPGEIVGYPVPWIVSPGDSVEIKVSCRKIYRNDILTMLGVLHGTAVHVPNSSRSSRDAVYKRSCATG